MANILVTGSNRGIGLEFVTKYLDRSDTVIATCRDPQVADRLNYLKTGNPHLQVLQLDVARPESFAGFAASLEDQPVDVFINNAGVYGPRSAGFGEVTEQEWLPVFRSIR